MTLKDPAALCAYKQRYYQEHRDAILARVKAYQATRIGRTHQRSSPETPTLQGTFPVTYGDCVKVEALPEPQLVTRLRLEGRGPGEEPEALVGVVPKLCPVESLVRYVLARDVRPWSEKESA
jgi:hypothetical protein